MKVSVLIPCLNRHKLVERSLYTLSRQTYPTDIFVIDDGSRLGLEEIASEAGVYYERLRGTIDPDGPDARLPATAWRHVYFKTDHEFVIITHPEVLVPFDAVERMIDGHQSPRRSTPLLYFLSKPLLESIDEYPWREDVHSVQQAPGFMGIYNRWGLFNHQMHGWNHHVCFTGQTREDWDIHNFLPDPMGDDSHDDAWLLPTEHQLTIRTGVDHQVNKVDLTVYHQFHGTSYPSAPPNEIWHIQNYGVPAPKSYGRHVPRSGRLPLTEDQLPPGNVIPIRSVWTSRMGIQGPSGLIYKWEKIGDVVAVKRGDVLFIMDRNRYASKGSLAERICFEIA